MRRVIIYGVFLYVQTWEYDFSIFGGRPPMIEEILYTIFTLAIAVVIDLIILERRKLKSSKPKEPEPAKQFEKTIPSRFQNKNK